MTQRDNILQELNELGSQLVNTGSENIYTVPVGYFEGLLGQVMSRIKALEADNVADELAHLSPLLSKLSKQVPFTVPVGYFEGLNEKAMQSVLGEQTVQEETVSISPLLAGLKKEMPFAVPEGYFENLATVAAAKEADQEAKVISLVSRKWLRYAAAAIVTGILAVTAFLVFGDDKKMESASIVRFEKKLSKEIKKMSDQELNEFIEFTNEGMVGDEKVSNNTSEEIKDLLKDVPDTELKEFLEETSFVDNEGETTSSMN